MASKFLDNLANALDQQFSIGENTNRSLDDVVNGKTVRYGKLGDFSGQFDQSAERRYLEEGYLRKDTYNTDPKVMQILTQSPNITVLVKKRMFSSLAENYRPDLMDSEEKLFFKASKTLFDNKAKQISALEKLSKIEKIVEITGRVNDLLVPLIINLADQVDDNFGIGNTLFGKNISGGSGSFSKIKKITDRLKTVYAFGNQSQYTTWIKNNLSLYPSVGDGTGVLELTNVASLNTRINVNSIDNQGTCDFKLIDPYELCSITELDIEKAISDASNTTYNRKFFQLGKQSAEEILERNKQRLNNLRSSRGAGNITFNVSPDTIYGRRVIAILDNLGKEIVFEYNPGFGGVNSQVVIPSNFLRGGEEVGEEGVDTKTSKTPAGSSVRRLYSDSELSLFNDIVKGIFEKIQLEKNSLQNISNSNEETNYIRRKMRLHFLGKSIIQPMDVVHVYINSKTASDNKVMGGIKDSFNFINYSQKLANTFTNIENIAAKFNPKQSIDFQIEKSVFVGDDFPNLLWAQMRDMFVKEDAGTHVFAGIVDKVNNSGEPGNSSINISCVDNTKYFDFGVVNFNPSADTFNGSLYDNLTPFKDRFDESPLDKVRKGNGLFDLELLDENKKRLKSGIIKHKAGDAAGSQANELNINRDIYVDATGRASRVMYAPDGLVYKWKEGIGVLTQFGTFADINVPERIGNQSITENPFAGQDVMNVISLSITGEPYNYNTYYNAVASLQGGINDPNDNTNGAHSFYKSFTTDLARRNMLWGNFIPFKNLVVSPADFRRTISGISQIKDLNDNISKTISQIQRIKNSVGQFTNIVDINKTLNEQLQILRDNLQKSSKTLPDKLDENINVYGNDVSLNFDNLLNNKSSKNYNSKIASQNLRRKLNFLTRRMSYMVRANEDKNLLIIDDTYDKDYDMMAFEKSLKRSLELYKSDFKTVRDNISSVAKLLNLEVYCDTQGHIRVRPPQYNKMPSSVFYRMMVMKNLNKIQIFPKFLNDLFLDQIDSLVLRLEVCEEYLRLYSSILDPSLTTDAVTADFLTDTSKGSATGEAGFSFISDDNGDINIRQDIVDKVNSLDNLDRSDIINFNTIKNQTNLKRVFNPATAVLKLFGNNEPKTDINFDVLVENDRIRVLLERIEKKDQKVNINELAVDTDVTLADKSVRLSTGKTNKVNFTKAYEDLLFRISERQKILKLLYGAIKNLIESKALDTDPNAANKALFPNLAGNREIPEALEHLIEDESYDDYGPGSGSRYIISNNKVKNYNISEKSPPFNKIDVRGQFDPYISENSLPSNLNTLGKNNNNSLTTASAIDYDSWRMYGLIDGGTVAVPFLTHPGSQAAPFAATLLSMSRKNILRGSVSIVGNEYMQPGDVIYLEQKGLLFYVETVSHSFSYGNSFDTTLELTYGHPPGEYIPTYLDTIGKLLYNNKDNAELINYRQSSSYNEKNIGVIIADPSAELKSASEDEIKSKSLKVSKFASNNNKVIENILWSCAYAINANNSEGKKVRAKIELRTYYNTNEGILSADNPSYLLASSVAKQLISGITETTDGVQKVVVPGLGENAVVDYNDKAPVDLNPTNKEHRSPSGKAWDYADELGSRYGGNNVLVLSDDTADTKNIKNTKNALYKYVIDCWIVFEQIDKSDNKK